MSESSAIATSADGEWEIPFDEVWFKIFMQHLSHADDWFTVQSEISYPVSLCTHWLEKRTMIVAYRVQDLSNFFFSHCCFREVFAAGGSFAISFTQDFDRAFFFLDFFLDANCKRSFFFYKWDRGYNFRGLPSGRISFVAVSISSSSNICNIGGFKEVKYAWIVFNGLCKLKPNAAWTSEFIESYISLICKGRRGGRESGARTWIMYIIIP